MYLFPILFVFVVFSLLLMLCKYKHNYWLRRGIPHKSPTFVFGNLGDFHLTKATVEIYNKFKSTGPFAGFYFFLAKTVLLLDPELIRNVLIKDFHNFEDRGMYCNENDDPLTGNLFFLDSSKWRGLRHKLTPMFSAIKVRKMFPAVLKIGDELTAVMEEHVKGGPKVLEITDILGRFTADVIGVCAFGLDCNSLRNPQADFVVMGRRYFNEPRHNRIVGALIHSFQALARQLRMRVINQSVHDFYMGIVRNTVEQREKCGVQRNDLMDVLLALRKSEGLTIEEIAAQAFAFFIAGFETSSMTMSYMLYELAQHQDLQEKLRTVVREAFMRHKNILSYECMQEVPYLEQMKCETLRKHPIVPHLIRKTTNRYETADPKYYIESGTSVLVSVFALHHDPAYYPEPEKFKPERFTNEEIQKRPPCTYLPFGEGPRNCIGAAFSKIQTFIGLMNLLKDFRFSVATETKIPLELIKKSVLLNPQGGIYLRVEKIL